MQARDAPQRPRGNAQQPVTGASVTAASVAPAENVTETIQHIDETTKLLPENAPYPASKPTPKEPCKLDTLEQRAGYGDV